MSVLLLLSLLRRLRKNNDDCQQDYERELRRQCKRQRRWSRRHPHCPAPMPTPVAAVPVVVQSAMLQSTSTPMQQPQVVQPAGSTTQKLNLVSSDPGLGGLRSLLQHFVGMSELC
ncbi:hypothetical protein PC118_g15845 [Phytophthora cactorum]|uniref:Uncharacterized protein n=1 Tax=Phytophthora cactorum TaxID=29920 RepID=A0A8T1FCM4_9STRA|nr:hypothetical protein PC111_g14947 [Phytophthora cactorum]KAG2972159.1 hypothetical protein PC118_g15845 [Phytophthora cactorum]KAG3071064.1 hypothetical protein PC122_g15839 [Phytophthora cactorum]